MPVSKIDSALKDLICTFNELNNPTIEELDSEPSPLEFMRYVSRNSPFVVRGGASSWKATREWDSNYLRSAMAGQTVKVAVTPHGFVLVLLLFSPTVHTAVGIFILDFL